MDLKSILPLLMNNGFSSQNQNQQQEQQQENPATKYYPKGCDLEGEVKNNQTQNNQSGFNIQSLLPLLMGNKGSSISSILSPKKESNEDVVVIDESNNTEKNSQSEIESYKKASDFYD